MKKSFLAAAALSLVALASADAQTGCTGNPSLGTAAENTKQQAADVFQFVAPQLGHGLEREARIRCLRGLAPVQ